MTDRDAPRRGEPWVMYPIVESPGCTPATDRTVRDRDVVRFKNMSLGFSGGKAAVAPGRDRSAVLPVAAVSRRESRGPQAPPTLAHPAPRLALSASGARH